MPKTCLYFLKNTNECCGFQSNLTLASEWSPDEWVSFAEEEIPVLHILKKSPMMIRHTFFQQIRNEMKCGWKWTRRLMKPISARTDCQSQWALCGMCEVHVKWAAVPGRNTTVCLTHSWRLLSSQGKQGHPGLWSRPPWINRIGGRSIEKGMLRAWRRLDPSGLLLSRRCWDPTWQESFHLPNVILIIVWLFYFSIFGL